MPRRPSKCYRKMQLAYTRPEYIRKYPGLPDGLKKLTYGNSKGSFEAKVSLVALIDGQVSAKAIESIRMLIHRELGVLNENDYCFKVIAYPHHIIRGHGLIGVAKAERISKGMKLAFGLPEFRMAQIRKGHSLVEICMHDDPITYGVSRKALNLSLRKLPLKWHLDVQGISISNLHKNVNLPKRKVSEPTGGTASIQREIS